jgi:MFS family permease
MERTVVPLLAATEFGLESAVAALAFIAAFGSVKAGTNLLAGGLGDRYGRRNVLLAGWLAALPVPLMVMWAPSWGWIIAANLLLGLSQGLTWSTTVLMKIDLAGPRRRGLAMGLNEFAGYLALATVALATSYLAEAFGLRPAPMYLGMGIVVAGLAVSWFFVRDTGAHVTLEAASIPASALRFRQVFARASWSDPALSTASHVGLINNLNDGLAWGLFPVFFAASGLSVARIGVLAFVYPATWGLLQLGTGALSDRIGRKWLIAGGMVLQGAALAVLAAGDTFRVWVGALVLLGAGTAMVYPTLIAVVGDVAHPTWRGAAVGVYRLWRDAGYVVGAIASGLLADALGVGAAIAIVALITCMAGALAAVRLPETRPVERTGPAAYNRATAAPSPDSH